MDKLKYKLQCFMSGRYGTDELYKFLWIVYVVLLLINCFVHSAGISIALWIILIYTLFRMMSKNVEARQKENAKYLIYKNRFMKWLGQTKERISDREHVYRSCPHCKATIRFPRRKGRHDATCPRCKKPFKVNVLW